MWGTNTLKVLLLFFTEWYLLMRNRKRRRIVEVPFDVLKLLLDNADLCFSGTHNMAIHEAVAELQQLLGIESIWSGTELDMTGCHRRKH
jgi:hypothetical protein